MELGSIWRRWRQTLGLGSTAAEPARPDPRKPEEWAARLAAAGVARDLAARLVPDLVAAQRELGRGSSPALIRGAVLAATLQAESQAQVERSLRDVREVERLLGAFSGELEKLDEVLEVLAAYAQRMRPQTPVGPTRRTLH
jgi:hypothetical protein